ncbi:response regulator [Desulfobacterales bacterium HSG2]|nr:response regulator [Desulfobacterales bacterium HSG2]
MESYLIMVVENSIAVRELIAFTLERQGYKVVKAEDGLDALKKLDDNRPNLIFTDLNMPNMNGIELIREVRAKSSFRFIPIIVVTTETRTSEKKQEAKAAGATAWITKPFKKDQILTVVKKILG